MFKIKYFGMFIPRAVGSFNNSENCLNVWNESANLT